MKTPLSFLFIFLFLLGLCQQKDSLDYDKDGVIDIEDYCPRTNGQRQYNGCDCISIYKNDKGKFEKDYQQLKKTDFKNFLEELFKIKILKELTSNKAGILLLSELRYESGEGKDSCPYYKKNIDEEILKKLWNEVNFMKFQKALKNKIIINKLSFDDNIKSDLLLNNIKKGVYKGIYLDVNGNTKKFVYYSRLKPKNKLILHENIDKIFKEQFVEFGIRIEPIEIQKSTNTYKVLIIIINEKGEINNEELIFQYTNGKWINLYLNN